MKVAKRSARWEEKEIHTGSWVLTRNSKGSLEDLVIDEMLILKCTITELGHAVEQLVEALRYKPEGGGFDFRWCHWIFSLT